MKLRSVQFKFLTTLISAMVAITICIGGLSIYEVDKYIRQQSENLVDLTCSNEAAQVNDIFGDIEKSVRIMESYVLSFYHPSDDIRDPEKQNEIVQKSDEMFFEIAANTDGVIAYYLRFDPEISNSTAGLFYSQMDNGSEYVSLPPTDLSLYDRNDTEHVGWFWQPYDAKQPVWMNPYYNQNNDVLMISFVIPLYHENQFIGVVGMDYDYTILIERIHQIKIYENGFAHLELNDMIVHSGNKSEMEEHSHEDSGEYLCVSEELTNGMKLVLSASYADIWQIRYEIAIKIILTVIVLAVVFTLIAIFTVKKIVTPLKKLTDASIRLSDGDYDVEIAHSNTLEIKLLSTAFETMILKLREHKKLQHLLAYRDSLTGLRNTTSYKQWVSDFDSKIKDEKTSFGIIVLDINYLKETNDTYGHIAGNKLIVTASQIISDTFKRSPVFRIGGDEFLVILQNRDFEDREALFERFETDCANTTVEVNDAVLSISIAKGFSIFDPAKDTQFSDVFNRADEEMYRNKKTIKMAHP